MAIDVNALKVKPTVMPKRAGTRSGRDLGPNPWLDKTWPFNLQASYDNAEAFEMTLPGAYVKAKYTRGEVKGQEYDKLTGDAADAIVQIRDAAEKLGLGVSIPVTQAVIESGPRKGQPREGYFVVKYQAAKRKQYKKDEQPTPEPGPWKREDTPAGTAPAAGA
jgi:hypothetical protein